MKTKKSLKANKYEKLAIAITTSIAVFLFIVSSYSILYSFISANNMKILILSGTVILALIVFGLYSKSNLIKKITKPLK